MGHKLSCGLRWHLAKVDADAELHPALGRSVRVFCLESALNVDGAIHRLKPLANSAKTLSPAELTNLLVLLDETVDDLAVRGQGAERRLLILPDEAAVADHVGAEHRRKLTFQHPPNSIVPPSARGSSIRPISSPRRLCSVASVSASPYRVGQYTSTQEPTLQSGFVYEQLPQRLIQE